ncbi:MAG TPA: lytic transglycosylase domain-containing protein [Longimicrobiales bacterium]|nr:lytic transglycosylase domain-containing protein [Longimicrobiales bacterium]
MSSERLAALRFRIPRPPASVVKGALGAGALCGCVAASMAAFSGTWIRSAGAAAAEPARALPSLPALPARFDGQPLAARIRPPAVPFEQMDELLTSPVLWDPEFARAVHWWVDYWTTAATEWVPGYLERMEEHGAAVDSALVSHGFPASLRYLPFIESGYDPRVRSRVGAVGLWQLMPATARGLGLEVTRSTDERRDPEKSTEAALRYLGTLYREFDSWFLALAAYNAGPTRVRAVLRRYAAGEPRSDVLFWSLRHHFSRETRDFVPKLYGAMFVASRPEAYGYGEGARVPQLPMVAP